MNVTRATRFVPLSILALGLALLATTSAPAAEPEGAAHKAVNINTASSPELVKLPRVGPKLADRIVAHRAQNGPFKRAEDLMEVKGVGEKTFALLKPYLATSGPTTLTEKVSSAKSKKAGGPRAKRTRSNEKPAPEAAAGR